MPPLTVHILMHGIFLFCFFSEAAAALFSYLWCSAIPFISDSSMSSLTKITAFGGVMKYFFIGISIRNTHAISNFIAAHKYFDDYGTSLA